jgi:predicted secreted protein
MRIKLIIMALFGLLSLSMLASQTLAQAQPQPQPQPQPFNPLGGACANAPANPACTQNKDQNGSNANPTVNIIRSAADVIALIGGIGAVVIIIISGFMFVTAGGVTPGQRSGDPNRIKTARATLTGAIVGLIIIALAWTIVAFVTDKLIKT